MSEIVRVNGGDIRKVVTDPAEALKMLATTAMRPFTKEDWYGFAGCETKDPMIGESGEFVIILDGNTLNIIHDEDDYGGEMFKMEAM